MDTPSPEHSTRKRFKRSGAGTESEATYKMTHTRDGLKRSFTDGNGAIVTFSYDGFHRYQGYTNPAETSRLHHLDANGNVTKVEIVGEVGLVDSSGAPQSERHGNLREISYFYDEWDRIFRTEQQWRDPRTQELLGKSNWKGESGKIITVAEFGDNGYVSGLWREEDNPTTVQYDGAQRVTHITDTTGEETFVEYDANDNVTKLTQLGAPGTGERTKIIVRSQYDALDRLVWQQVNEDAPVRIEYNLFNNVVRTIGKTGLEVRYLSDGLGRQTGHSFQVGSEQGAQQKILRRNEYDDNYRLTAFTDATGNRTVYRYDSRNRVIGIVEPNGNAYQYEYDANDRLVRAITSRKQEIKQDYDRQGRLNKRRLLSQDGKVEKIEQFHYDGLGRLVAAVTDDAALTYHYDSFSRLLEEQQNGVTVRYGYDAAGNLNSLSYPGGKQLVREFDSLRRITVVKELAGQTIANYSYHAENQLQTINFGGKLEANLTWNNRAYLESIEYRRTDNNQLVDGCRYQYDAAGNIVHEIQLDAGPTKGDRYFYDNANRVVRAQFDVDNVNDPNSSFEREVVCDPFSEGLWKRKAEFDGNRVLQKESIGTLTSLNGYDRFGNLSFEYDKNGNITFIGENDSQSAPLPLQTAKSLVGRNKKSTGNYWLYQYDEHNRLIKATECDFSGNVIQVVEYFYDASSRLIKRIVTDAKGAITEYRYVYAGGLLIEEYVNGQLTLVYVYGALGSMPVQLTKKDPSLKDKNYLFTFNGRGGVTALHEAQTLNTFERFAIDPFGGLTLPKELKGIRIPWADRQNATKGILSSILSGGFGKGQAQSFMHDFQTGNGICKAL